MTNKDRQSLEQFVRGTAEKMGESAMVMSIFTDNYKKNVDSLLQFAVAMMMDKPLFLLVPAGCAIPEKVRRAADGIEYYQTGDKESLHAASLRLFERAREKGFVE